MCACLCRYHIGDSVGVDAFVGVADSQRGDGGTARQELFASTDYEHPFASETASAGDFYTLEFAKLLGSEYAHVRGAAGAEVVPELDAFGADEGRPAPRHRRILRDSEDRLTMYHYSLLAAKAGVVALDPHCLASLRVYTKRLVETCVRESVTRTEHRKSRTVSLPDVVAALWSSRRYKVPVIGSGRLGELFTIHVYRAPEARDEETRWEVLAADDRARSIRAVAEFLAEQEEEEPEQPDDDANAGVGEVYDPTAELDPEDLEAAHTNSLALIRMMQRAREPVFPFNSFAKFVREVGQDFKTDLNWSMAAFRLIDEACEASLVQLLEYANTAALNRKDGVVRPEDVGFAVKVQKK